MIYDLDTQFYVTYAIHERRDMYGNFTITRIESGRFGLYSTLFEKSNRTDGEIAEALNRVVSDSIGDGLHNKMVTLINFWVI